VLAELPACGDERLSPVTARERSAIRVRPREERLRLPDLLGSLQCQRRGANFGRATSLPSTRSTWSIWSSRMNAFVMSRTVEAAIVATTTPEV
jgi:hypothetical protein